MYKGNMIDDLMARADNAIALGKLARMERVCGNCGEKFGEHCGWDERCPHPNRHEPNQPFFIDGKHFILSGAEIRRSQGISDFALDNFNLGGNLNG